MVRLSWCAMVLKGPVLMRRRDFHRPTGSEERGMCKTAFELSQNSFRKP